MSLSRWFFRWAQWDAAPSADDAIMRRVLALPVRGKFEGVEAYLGTSLGVYSILLAPSFWSFGVGNWTRAGLRRSLERRVAMERIPQGVKGRFTVMLWSCDESLVDLDNLFPVRILDDEAAALEEVSFAWGWIGHYIRQPVMWQKTTTPEEAVKEFDAWLRKPWGPRGMPELPPPTK